MHDCPRCQVPLHGHEQVCPACGFKQRIRIDSHLPATQAPKMNPLPLAIAFILLGGIFFIAAKNSWIGKMMTRGPIADESKGSLSCASARQMLEQKIQENLKSLKLSGRLTWTAEDKTVDRNFVKPVSLTIDTRLADPEQRKSIINPIKDLMETAQVSTITLIDTRSRKTWTYSLSLTPNSTESNDADGSDSKD